MHWKNKSLDFYSNSVKNKFSISRNYNYVGLTENIIINTHHFPWPQFFLTQSFLQAIAIMKNWSNRKDSKSNSLKLPWKERAVFLPFMERGECHDHLAWEKRSSPIPLAEASGDRGSDEYSSVVGLCLLWVLSFSRLCCSKIFLMAASSFFCLTRSSAGTAAAVVGTKTLAVLALGMSLHTARYSLGCLNSRCRATLVVLPTYFIWTGQRLHCTMARVSSAKWDRSQILLRPVILRPTIANTQTTTLQLYRIFWPTL